MPFKCIIHKFIWLQVLGFDIPGTRGRYMYGTGIISVIGTSFTFLNVSAASIGNMMVSADGCAHDDNLLLQHSQAVCKLLSRKLISQQEGQSA